MAGHRTCTGGDVAGWRTLSFRVSSMCTGDVVPPSPSAGLGEHFLDMRFVRELDESGFIDRLYP